MSEWQVYKFGGSSLGAEGRLPVVLRRVGEAPRPLVLVVSALGDSTEWLLDAGRAAATGDETGATTGVAQALALARGRAAELLDPRTLATAMPPSTWKRAGTSCGSASPSGSATSRW